MTSEIMQSFIDERGAWIVWIGALIFASFTITLFMVFRAVQHRKRIPMVSPDPHPATVSAGAPKPASLSKNTTVFQKCAKCGAHTISFGKQEVCSSIDCRYNLK